jgi:hypothetical protein
LLINFQRQLPRDMTSDTSLRAYLEEQEEKFKAKHGHSFVQKILQKFKRK